MHDTLIPTTSAPSLTTSSVLPSFAPNPAIPSVDSPSSSISDEDTSVHGSSIMDEENEDLVAFRNILDGYDYMSSAEEDAILEDATLEDAPAEGTDISDTGSIDEHISLPDLNLDTDPVTTTTTTSSVPITTTSTTAPPTSDFSFQAPAITPVPLPPATVPSTSKALDLSSHLPPVPSPTTTRQTSSSSSVHHRHNAPPSSSASASRSSPTTIPSTSSRDVQGRTSVSKGGDVGLDIEFDSEYDMEVSNNWNKNKRKQFKPVTPMRDKKRRLRLNIIAQTIINSLASKLYR